MLRRIDPASALRIQPRDRKRLVRALEVFFLTGRPTTQRDGTAGNLKKVGYTVPVGTSRLYLKPTSTDPRAADRR